MNFADWCEAMEDRDYATVAQDKVGDWWISTVWLGLDLQMETPLIFETMVFDNSAKGLRESGEIMREAGFGGPVNLGPSHYQRRYATEAEAVAGHKEAVLAAQAGLIRRESGWS